MILSKEVENRWNNKHKKRYIDLGYIFTKCGDIFNVKVEDLSLKSNLKINVKCDVCNKEKTRAYKLYMKSYLNGGYYACCYKCSLKKRKETNLKKYGCEIVFQNNDVKNKIKQTNLERYGYESPLQNDDVKNKIKQTNLERYGYENPIQNEDVKNKTKETNLKRYGCEYTFQNEGIKNKIKQINLERYGFENPIQNEDVKNKTKETNLERYGCEYTFQNESIKNKAKQTNLEKYGCEYTFQNEDIKNKTKETILKRYGFEYASQNENIKNKTKQTNLERYGVEYISQNKTISEKAKQTSINRYGETFFKLVPSYNINSIIYLDVISDMLNIPIQHGVNGGEKKIVRYFVDGYIEKYNICIEWDEKYHTNIKQKEKDLIREKFLIEKYGCKIIRINEKEFLEDVKSSIDRIVTEIQLIINKLE